MTLPKFLTHPNPEIYLTGKPLVLDFETTNKDFGSPLTKENRLLLACWRFDGERKSVWGGEYDMQELAEDIKRADFLVAHNCFSGDQEFITSEGLFSFREKQGQTVNVWTELGWMPAKVNSYGTASTKKLTLVPYNRSRTSVMHEIEATHNHRWLVDRLYQTNKYGAVRRRAPDYVTTESLRVGDKIVAQLPNYLIEKDSDAFRHGLIFADGAKCSGREAYQIRLCGAKERYKVLFPNYTYPPSAKSDPVINYYKSDAKLKELPTTKDRRYIANFIEGWQQLDGTDSAAGGSRIVQTVHKEAADWLCDNASIAGWYVTGRSECLKKGYKEGLLYSVVLTKDPDMGWTVKAIEEGQEQEVFCAEVEGIDRFTLKHGIYTGNCKFELGWLLRSGIDLREILVYDTMLCEWVLLGNLSRGLQDLSLNHSCARRGLQQKEDTVSTLISLGVSPENIPESWLEDYCHQDVAITEDLFLAQRQILKDKGLLHIQYSRCLLTPVLTDMEFSGVTLDKDRVMEEYDAVLKDYKDVVRQLDSMAKDNGFDGINWRSTQQKAEYLYDVLKFEELKDRKGEPLRTEKGARSTDAATIASLKATTSKQRKFLAVMERLSGLDAKLTKSLNFFKAVCEEHDCTFFGELRQGTTKTHRLSSTGRPILLDSTKKTLSAQLQNLAREYKRLFKAKKEGWSILEIDSAQLEFRAAAILTGDEVAIKEIVNKEDVHKITADYLTAHGEPTERQEAKPKTFRPLFAGTSGTKAEQAYCKFFQQKYHVMYNAQNKWVEEVLKTKQLRTAYGMIYYWPFCKMQGSGYITHTTEIFNAPIQGFATAECMPIAIVHAWHRCKGLPLKFILTVHDSLILEVDMSQDLAFLKGQLVEAFTTDIYNFLKTCYNYSVGDVPLGCGIKIGPHWGEGKEEKYE